MKKTSQLATDKLMSPRFHNGVLIMRKNSGRYKNGLTPKSGFTLVELAIVIVIIGLLVGGVLQGQELIRQARISSFAVTMQQYKASIQLFKSKYNGYPGDMNNATLFFGATSPTGANIVNGNASGIIENNQEAYQAWVHLALGKFIKQGASFTGAQGAVSVSHTIPNVNVPSFLDKGGITFYNATIINPTACDANWYCLNYGNVFFFGLPEKDFYTYLPIFTPAEASQIDTKIDDGKPASGNFIAWKMGGDINPNCATTAVEATALYNISSSAILCSGIYKLEL
jgi:prepilin-type N-terminal cleavage/methylation domain-containing protein